MTRFVRLVAGLVLGVVGLSVGATAAQDTDDPGQRPRVLATRVSDAITPVMADHLADGVAQAEREGFDAYLVELDTPGGLDTSMRDIVQTFLDAEVPVIVWVSPRGARAASAGAIITFSSHVAAMAPGTAIGAATPIGGEGGEDLEQKVVEDAAAYAEAIAELRDRDVDFAVATVREGKSASAEEASRIGAIDFLASSKDELFSAADGREVDVRGGRTVVVRTAGARIEAHDIGIFRRTLQFLAHPNIAFLLLSIGTLGIIYELASPGIGIGGVVGVVMVILALFALSVLPINVAGIALLLLALSLFAAELFAPGIGVFAVLGAVALTLSGLFLFRDAPGLSVSIGVVLPIAIVVGGGVVVAGRLVWRTRRPSTTTGAGLFVGREVTVARVNGEHAQAFVEGAWWQVRSTGSDLKEGQKATVAGVDGLVLLAEPDNQGGSP